MPRQRERALRQLDKKLADLRTTRAPPPVGLAEGPVKAADAEAGVAAGAGAVATPAITEGP